MIPIVGDIAVSLFKGSSIASGKITQSQGSKIAYQTDMITLEIDRRCSETHGDVIKWKHFPRYWPFVKGSTVHHWILLTKASDTVRALMIYLMNKRLSKQSRCRWSETPYYSLYCHCIVRISVRLKNYQLILWDFARSGLKYLTKNGWIADEADQVEAIYDGSHGRRPITRVYHHGKRTLLDACYEFSLNLPPFTIQVSFMQVNINTLRKPHLIIM